MYHVAENFELKLLCLKINSGIGPIPCWESVKCTAKKNNNIQVAKARKTSKCQLSMKRLLHQTNDASSNTQCWFLQFVFKFYKILNPNFCVWKLIHKLVLFHAEKVSNAQQKKQQHSSGKGTQNVKMPTVNEMSIASNKRCFRQYTMFVFAIYLLILQIEVCKHLKSSAMWSHLEQPSLCVWPLAHWLYCTSWQGWHANMLKPGRSLSFLVVPFKNDMLS